MAELAELERRIAELERLTAQFKGRAGGFSGPLRELTDGEETELHSHPADDAPDEKVKVSPDDTTASYLLSKLSAGAGISITEVSPGGDEDARIACTLNGVPSGAIILWNNSDTCPTGYTRVSGADNRLLMGVSAGAGGVAGTGTHMHYLHNEGFYTERLFDQWVGWGHDANRMHSWTAPGGSSYYILDRYTDTASHLYYCYKVLV